MNNPNRFADFPRETGLHASFSTQTRRWAQTLLIGCTVCVLAACASRAVDEISAEEYFSRGMAAMGDQRLAEAGRNFEQLIARYPFDQRTPHAQLELMAAYFSSSDFERAEKTADTFINDYPHHEQVDFAWYIRGRALYEVDRSLLVSHFGYDLADFDLGRARLGVVVWQRFMTRFPQSAYAPEVQAYLLYYREILARHELRVADFYMRKGAYLAAANRARYVLENFPSAGVSDSALAVLKRAYQALGLGDVVADASPSSL